MTKLVDIHLHFERLLESLKNLITESPEDREARGVEMAKSELRFYLIKAETSLGQDKATEKRYLINLYNAKIDAATTKEDIFKITDEIKEKLLPPL